MGKPTAASTPARDLLTRNWDRKVAEKLQSVLPNKPNEADLHHAVEPLSEKERIPEFDPKDKVHKRLAELSMQAHELARTPASDKPQASSRRLEEVEAEIDVESAKLWNLSASDLAEIQRSLKELTE
jgi:hypothetical protein